MSYYSFQVLTLSEEVFGLSDIFLKKIIGAFLFVFVDLEIFLVVGHLHWDFPLYFG